MRSVRTWISEHPSADLVVSVSVAFAYLLGHVEDLPRPTVDNATALIIYQTLAGVGAALLALVFAAIAIIRALDPGRRLTRLNLQHGQKMTSSMKAVIRGLGVATGLAIVAMALNESGWTEVLARAMVVFAAALGASRMTRLAWVFGLILDVNDGDLVGQSRADDPALQAPLNLRTERRAAGQ